MAPSHYGDWVRLLVEALEQVREIENHDYYYQQELRKIRLERELRDARSQRGFPISDPAHDRRSFYRDIRRAKGFYARQCLPLRSALQHAVDIVSQHPALTRVLNTDGQEHEFVVGMLNQTRQTSCLAIVAGLMCRAQKIGKDGLNIASYELKSLLDPSLEEGVDPGSNELTVGYHVSLFYGLSFNEDIHITDGLMAVPLERTEPFLNREVLAGVAPHIVKEHRWNAVGAMIRSVPWKPMLLRIGDESEPQMNSSGSFFEDAHKCIEFLALAHGAPVVTLMDIHACIHRTTLLLLGEPHYHSGWICKIWTRSYGNLRNSNQLDADAFNKARHVFSCLDHQQHQKLAPVISRLSEALARSGQYALDDKILDVAIALEQMYQLGGSEISFKLKTRAACFLESDTKARQSVFDNVNLLYKARSEIVHGPKKKSKEEQSITAKKEAFRKGFDVARNSVIKLLQEGRPADWNEVILARAESKEPHEGEQSTA